MTQHTVEFDDWCWVCASLDPTYAAVQIDRTNNTRKPTRAPDQVERWNELRHGGNHNLPARTPQLAYSMPIRLRSRQSAAAFSARARSALESLATILSRLASATPPALAIRCHLAASTTFISTPAPWA